MPHSWHMHTLVHFALYWLKQNNPYINIYIHTHTHIYIYIYYIYIYISSVYKQHGSVQFLAAPLRASPRAWSMPACPSSRPTNFHSGFVSRFSSWRLPCEPALEPGRCQHVHLPAQPISTQVSSPGSVLGGSLASQPSSLVDASMSIFPPNQFPLRFRLQVQFLAAPLRASPRAWSMPACPSSRPTNFHSGFVSRFSSWRLPCEPALEPGRCQRVHLPAQPISTQVSSPGSVCAVVCANPNGQPGNVL